LIALRNAELRLAMSPVLEDEWRKHQSRYARKWLSDMYARRRIARVVPKTDIQLRKATAKLATEKQRQAVQKDWHLVETAAASDHRVVSSDLRIKELLVSMVPDVAYLARLHWTCPADDGCCEWIEDGTPEDPERHLT